jgi:hypothetical protein
MEVTICKGNEHVLIVRFPYAIAYVEKMRQIPGARWDREARVWKFGYTYMNVERFIALFNGCPVVVNDELGLECEPLERHFGGA